MNQPVIFAGTPAFAADHLAALIEEGINVIAVVTQPDRPANRGKKLRASPVKELAIRHQLPVIQPERLSAADIAAYKPWLMVVVAYGQILNKSLLDLPEMGCINVHASVLPRWRGAAPIQRAIEAGDRETGITIIELDEGMDTGRMLCRESIPIASEDTAESLEEKLSLMGCGLLVRTLNNLPACLENAELQDKSKATYARKIKKDDAKIDWSLDSDCIARKVRAFNPDPMSYCFINDIRMRLIEVVSIDNYSSSSAPDPGTILGLDRKGLSVQCGKGVLQINILQLPLGKGKPLTAVDLVNSRSEMFRPGMILQ